MTADIGEPDSPGPDRGEEGCHEATRTRLQIGVIGLPHGLGWKVWMDVDRHVEIFTISVRGRSHWSKRLLALQSRFQASRSGKGCKLEK